MASSDFLPALPPIFPIDLWDRGLMFAILPTAWLLGPRPGALAIGVNRHLDVFVTLCLSVACHWVTGLEGAGMEGPCPFPRLLAF